jgi:hypothetical protein
VNIAMVRLAAGQFPVLIVTLLCWLATTAAGSQINFEDNVFESASYASFSEAAENQHAAGRGLMQTGGATVQPKNTRLLCALATSATPAATCRSHQHESVAPAS